MEDDKASGASIKLKIGETEYTLPLWFDIHHDEICDHNNSYVEFDDINAALRELAERRKKDADQA